MKQTKRRTQGGFTLAELMVVIVIIGLLVTVVAPNVFQRLGTARSSKVKADIRALDEAVTMYIMQNQGRLPEGLEELVEEDINGNTYIKQTSVPKDPWGTEYHFETLSRSKYRIWTDGADNAPGGEGEDRDYDSEMLKAE
jgi:general secretion pathway protein G